MKHHFKILARRNSDRGHREVKVTIDWTGISREDLMVLAKNALVNDLHARIQKSKGAWQEEVLLVARELVHHEPEALLQYQPREPRQHQPSAQQRHIESMLKLLSPEELRVLLSN